MENWAQRNTHETKENPVKKNKQEKDERQCLTKLSTLNKTKEDEVELLTFGTKTRHSVAVVAKMMKTAMITKE